MKSVLMSIRKPIADTIFKSWTKRLEYRTRWNSDFKGRVYVYESGKDGGKVAGFFDVGRVVKAYRTKDISTDDLPFLDTLGRPDRDNVIDGYINKNEEDVCADGIWQKYFTEQPAPLTAEDIAEYFKTIDGVALGSDAFFPFSDNIERAKKSGVKYIAEPGGSIRDDVVIECANKYGMTMAFTGMRLFHH